MRELFLYLLPCFLLLSSGLVILRIIVRRAYLHHGRLTLIPATLQAILFFVFGGFPALFLQDDWPAVDVHTLQHVLGLFLIFGGLALLLYGMVHLGLSRSVGLGKPVLERSGLYRYTRNPQALACGAYVLGFAMLWPSGYAVGWVFLYMILIHAMVLTEEEHLVHTHGDTYKSYCQQVPRYMGWGSVGNNVTT